MSLGMIIGILHTDFRKESHYRGPYFRADEEERAKAEFIGKPLLFEHKGPIIGKVRGFLKSGGWLICVAELYQNAQFILSELERGAVFGLSVSYKSVLDESTLARLTPFRGIEVSVVRRPGIPDAWMIAYGHSNRLIFSKTGIETLNKKSRKSQIAMSESEKQPYEEVAKNFVTRFTKPGTNEINVEAVQSLLRENEELGKKIKESDDLVAETVMRDNQQDVQAILEKFKKLKEKNVLRPEVHTGIQNILEGKLSNVATCRKDGVEKVRLETQICASFLGNMEEMHEAYEKKQAELEAFKAASMSIKEEVLAVDRKRSAPVDNGNGDIYRKRIEMMASSGYEKVEIDPVLADPNSDFYNPTRISERLKSILSSSI